jgi:putative tryptophan/tyrosine transport system substrate-binding protein
MKWLTLLAAFLAALVTGLPVFAQQRPAELPIVGYLRLLPPVLLPDQMREQLTKRGLIDGQTVRIVQRDAGGKAERLPELALAMVREGATVIIAVGIPAARAVQAATTSIPIVTTVDFVGEKLVASLSRPEGNMTGVSPLLGEIEAKKLDLLHQLLPEAKRFGVLNDGNNREPGRIRLVNEAAVKLGLQLTWVDVITAADLEPAFQSFQREGATTVLVNNSSLLAVLLQPRIAELTAKYRLPLMCEWRSMVEAGCLASYGTTLAEMYGIVAYQVDRILKGAKPADLPIQQPTKFELVVNGRTAKAFGLALTPAVLLRADEVIE